MSIVNKHRALALLLDPEKADLSALPLSADCCPDYIFVGGSTGGDTTPFVRALKEKLSLSAQRSVSEAVCTLSGEAGQDGRPPIILFPGNAAQFTPEADAILYLSLLSGDNPEYLVTQQIRSARRIHNSSVEVIPTAYILIDGGVETSTMRVTGTKPLNPSDPQTIIDTCIAAELMGKKAIYLEAGSGAKVPVSPDIIREVRTGHHPRGATKHLPHPYRRWWNPYARSDENRLFFRRGHRRHWQPFRVASRGTRELCSFKISYSERK